MTRHISQVTLGGASQHDRAFWDTKVIKEVLRRLSVGTVISLGCRRSPVGP